MYKKYIFTMITFKKIIHLVTQSLSRYGPMRNEGGREDGKWSEYAWDRGDQWYFVF